MNNNELKRMQEVQLEIALEVKRVCDALGLNYFLDSGSLLGAVRHHGFIPWDDDIDFGMLRSDYDEFLSKAPALLDKKYYLQTWETDSKFPGAYAKIRKNGTIYREVESKDSGSHEGIYIDLFPYDTYPDNEKKRKWQRKRYYITKRLLIIKCGYKPWISARGLRKVIKFVSYSLAYVATALIPKKTLIKYYKYFSEKYNNEDSEYYYEQAAISSYGKWIIPRTCFKHFIELDFEGHMFKTPCDTDTYLRYAYGDYLTLPPVEKRVNHHHILKLDFGDDVDKK